MLRNVPEAHADAIRPEAPAFELPGPWQLGDAFPKS